MRWDGRTEKEKPGKNTGLKKRIFNMKEGKKKKERKKERVKSKRERNTS